MHRTIGFIALFVLSTSFTSALTPAEYQAYIDEINAAAQSQKKTIPAPAPVTQKAKPTPTSVSVTVSYNGSCPILPRALSRGSRGTDVTALQMFLIGQGMLSNDSATGFFGLLTERAVQAWQSKRAIVSSGTPATTGWGALGPRTRSALSASCGAPSAPAATNSPSTPSAGGTNKTNSFGGLPSSPSGSGNSSERSMGGSQPATAQTERAQIFTASTSTSLTLTETSSAKSCALADEPISHGASVTAFRSPSAPAGSSCVSEKRTCTNGVLSGSFTHRSCGVEQAPTPGRVKLGGPTVFFVSPSGSNATGEGSRTKPWATPLYAYNTLKQNYDLNGQTVRILLAPGTYIDSVQTSGYLMGQNTPGQVIITGDILNPSTVVIRPTANTGYALSSAGGGGLYIEGVKFDMSDSAAHSIALGKNSTIGIGWVEFGANRTPYSHMNVGDGSYLYVYGSYTISGSARAHINAANDSTVYFNTNGEPRMLSVYLVNTPNFSDAFIHLSSHAAANIQNIEWRGPAVGRRFLVQGNSTLDLGATGLQGLPGNTDGSADSLGQVIVAGGPRNSWEYAYVSLAADESTVGPGGSTVLRLFGLYTSENPTCWIAADGAAITSVPDSVSTRYDGHVAAGYKHTGPIQKTTTFTAQCLSMTGVTKGASAVVTVSSGTTNTIGERKRLSAPTTFFVHPQGSNATGDGSRERPWATPSHAYSILQSQYDLGGYPVTVKMFHGVYHDSMQAAGPLTGQAAGHGSLVFEGDILRPEGVVMQPALNAGYSFSASNGANFSIQGVKFGGGNRADEIAVGQFSTIGLSYVIFTPADHGYNHVTAAFNAKVHIEGDYTVEGPGWSQTNLDPANQSTIEFATGGKPGIIHVNILGEPSFDSGFVYIASNALIKARGVSWNGLAHTRQYLVEGNGVLDVGSTKIGHFPGNRVGETQTGGRVLSDGNGYDNYVPITPAELKLWATPSSVKLGGSVDLSWTARHVSQNPTCWVGGPGGNGGGYFTSAPDTVTTRTVGYVAYGTKNSGPLTASETYQLHCLAARDGTPVSSAPVTITVLGAPPLTPSTPPPPPAVCDTTLQSGYMCSNNLRIQVSPSLVAPGGSATVLWSASNVSPNPSCWVGEPGTSGGYFTTSPDTITTSYSSTTASGSKSTGLITTSKTFTLYCLKTDGTPVRSAPATVTVQ